MPYSSYSCLPHRTIQHKAFTLIEAVLATFLLMLGVGLFMQATHVWKIEPGFELRSNSVKNYVELVKNEVFKREPADSLFSIGAQTNVLSELPQPEEFVSLDVEVALAKDNSGTQLNYKTLQFSLSFENQTYEFLLYKDAP